METLDGYLAIAEVAARLRVTPSRVRQLLVEGALPRSMRVRNVVLIAADAVAAYEARRLPRGWRKGRARKSAPAPDGGQCDGR